MRYVVQYDRLSDLIGQKGGSHRGHWAWETKRGPLFMRCFASEWVGWVQAPEATQAISFKGSDFVPSPE